MASHNGQYFGAKYELSCNDLSVVLFTSIGCQNGWLKSLLLLGLFFFVRSGDEPFINCINISRCKDSGNLF